jgi:uncharacterized membrane protein
MINKEELERKLKEYGKLLDTFILGFIMGTLISGALITKIYTDLISSISIIQKLTEIK